MASPNLSLAASIEYFAVTPSDSTVFAGATRQLFIGGAGDVVVRRLNGTNVTFTSVPAGSKLDIQCDQVRSTGTTATLIVALM